MRNKNVRKTHKTVSIKRISAIAMGVVLASGLVACSNQSDSSNGTSSGTSSSASASGQDSNSQFPRTVETLNSKKEKTSITIEEQPKRVVSASVSLTGSLLAIDAPLVATGGGNGQSPVFTNEEGFGIQWADIARERDVKSMYQLAPTAEAILAQNPDLVIMSSVGGDQALDIYDQLASVVPVMVIDYSDKSWEDVTTLVGEATGLENKAQEVIKKYEDRAAEVKNGINVPPQPVNIVAFTPQATNFFTPVSAQGRIFESVGFKVEVPPEELRGDTAQGRQRSDAVGVTAENLGPALSGQTVFVQNLDGDGKASDQVRNNPQLAQHAPILEDRLYDLSPDAFRIDYYSAMNLLDQLDDWFKK